MDIVYCVNIFNTRISRLVGTGTIFSSLKLRAETKKLRAEIKKLRAETKKFRAKTKKLRADTKMEEIRDYWVGRGK